MLEKLFKLKAHGTTVKREILAGVTTFLTMAYILAVNPNILGTVMNANGVFVATAIASAIATFHILHIPYVFRNSLQKRTHLQLPLRLYLWKVFCSLFFLSLNSVNRL